MSQIPPPSPAAIKGHSKWSARHSHIGTFDRCAGGATPSPHSVAPTPISLARPITARSGPSEGKVSTVGEPPARIGCPLSLAPDPISAVLTTIAGRACFTIKASGQALRLVAAADPISPGASR